MLVTYPTLQTVPEFIARCPEPTYPERIIHFEKLAVKYLDRYLRFKVVRPYFIEFWFIMEATTLELQRAVPSLTQALQQPLITDQAQEPLLDLITRYHLQAFNPELKHETRDYFSIYQRYIDEIRPRVWEIVGQQARLDVPVPQISYVHRP